MEMREREREREGGWKGQKPRELVENLLTIIYILKLGFLMYLNMGDT